MIFRPLALYIGLRYTRAKVHNQFISFISLASMIGIALGVAVLITVLSVMNGFDYQIRNRFFAIAPQVSVLTRSDLTQNWQGLAKKIQQIPGVASVAPFVDGKGMVVNANQMQGVEVLGIDPSEEGKVSELEKEIKEGNLISLQPGQFNLVIGSDLASHLGVKLGDKVNLLIAKLSTTPLGMVPRYKRFTVSGIFNTESGFGFEMGVVYMAMSDASKLFALGSDPQQEVFSGLHVKLKNLYQAPNISQQMQQMLPVGYIVTNWTEQFGAFFKTLTMEKTMMFIILSLIIAVAIFNLVSTLVMVVNDKRSDIAILRTLGASPLTIMSTFIVQGALIGVIGTLCGLIGGIILALNVTTIADWIQTIFHVHFVSSSVYFIDYLPSRLELTDIIEVCVIAFGLSLLATLYPAWTAFKTQPAEALRYE